jgi:hypothetical protein
MVLCCMGLPFHVLKRICFLCEYLWWYIVHQLDLLFILLLAESCYVPMVHFQTHWVWLCLLHFSRDLTHVVLHGAVLSCVEENWFLCMHLPWCVVHQLDALFIFLLPVWFPIVFQTVGGGGFGRHC